MFKYPKVIREHEILPFYWNADVLIFVNLLNLLIDTIRTYENNYWPNYLVFSELIFSNVITESSYSRKCYEKEKNIRII